MQANSEMNKNIIRGIILDYKTNISTTTWRNKAKVIFDLKQKFGDGFNSYLADEIYDKILKEELEKEKNES